MSGRGITVQRKKLLLHPLNAPSTSVYSSNSGYPAITFEVSAMPGMLDVRSLKFNATVRCVKVGSTTLPTNNPNVAESADNGVQLNNRVGGMCTVGELNFSNLQNRSIEVIRNYSHYLSAVTPFEREGSSYTNRLSCSDPFQHEKSTTGALATNQQCSISVPLKCGLMNARGQHGTGISLDRDRGVNGLRLQLQLNSNSDALSVYTKYLPRDMADFSVPVTNVSAFATQGYQFELLNCTLSFDVLVPDPVTFREQVPSKGLLVYNSIESMYSVVQNSDQSVQLSLASDSVISAVSTFTPAVALNNFLQDSFRLAQPELGVTASDRGTPAPVTQLSLFRGGEQSPYSYYLDSEKQTEDKVPATQILQPGINGVSLFDNHSDLCSPYTTNGIANMRQTALGRDLSYKSMPDPVSTYIYGTAFDSARNGVSYKRGNNYTMRFQSGLDGTTPMGMHTYALVRNILQYSPGGLMVAQ